MADWVPNKQIKQRCLVNKELEQEQMERELKLRQLNGGRGLLMLIFSDAV